MFMSYSKVTKIAAAPCSATALLKRITCSFANIFYFSSFVLFVIFLSVICMLEGNTFFQTLVFSCWITYHNMITIWNFRLFVKYKNFKTNKKFLPLSNICLLFVVFVYIKKLYSLCYKIGRLCTVIKRLNVHRLNV
jgi:hypothetical protein